MTKRDCEIIRRGPLPLGPRAAAHKKNRTCVIQRLFAVPHMSGFSSAGAADVPLRIIFTGHFSSYYGQIFLPCSSGMPDRR